MRRNAGGRVGQDPWSAAGEAGLRLARGAAGWGLRREAAGARNGLWPLQALLGCLPGDPTLHPARSAMEPQRRKLLAAGEETFTRWFPAQLGKPAGGPSPAHNPLALESGLLALESVGLRLLIEGLGVEVELTLEERPAPSHKLSVRRNYFTRDRAPLRT